jgi:hypothetical protein
VPRPAIPRTAQVSRQRMLRFDRLGTFVPREMTLV